MLRKTKLGTVFFLFLLIVPMVIGLISYVDPTPADSEELVNATFVEINVTIEEPDLGEMIYNWNGTNYTMFSDNLILMYNVENRSVLGESSTYIVDASNQKLNATASGAADVRCDIGKYGNCAMNLTFGTNDFFNIPSFPDINTEVTVSIWISPTFLQTSTGYITKGNLGNDNGDWFLGEDSVTQGLPRFCLDAGTIACVDATTTSVVGEWMHVVGVYNTTQLIIYVNGVKEATADKTGAMDNNQNQVNFGAYYSPSFSFEGYVDEARIWNVSLSDEEVYQQYVTDLQKVDTDSWQLYVNQSYNATHNLTYGNYTYFVCETNQSGTEDCGATRTVSIVSELTPQAIPGISFIPPTLANGSNVDNETVEVNVSIVDSAITEFKYNWNGTNYTFYDDTLRLMYNFDNNSALGENDNLIVDLATGTYDATPLSGPYPTDGYWNGGFRSVGGSNDYLSTAFDLSDYDLDYTTVSIWINPTNTLASGTAFFSQNANRDGYLGYSIDYFSGTSSIRFVLDDGSVDGPSYVLTPQAGVWYHMVGVTNNGDAYLYIDGQLVASDTYDSTIAVDSAFNLTLMAAEWSGGVLNEFNGIVDEFRFYNRSFSHDEVYELYASNLQKINNTDWNFYIEQGLNATHNLSNGNYTHFSCASNVNGENCTDVRHIELGIDVADSINPNVTLLSPADNVNLTSATINFSCNVTDDTGLDNVSLWLTTSDNTTWYLDQTINLSGETEYQANFSKAMSEGNYTWNCEGVDQAGNNDFDTNRTFRLFDAPTVTLTGPADAATVEANGVDFNCNAQASAGLTNISLYITNSSGESFSLDQTNFYTGELDVNVTFNKNLESGNYIWNCLGYDQVGGFAWGTNRTLNVIEFLVTDTYDTSIEYTSGGHFEETFNEFWDVAMGQSSLSIEDTATFEIRVGLLYIVANVSFEDNTPPIITVTSPINTTYFEDVDNTILINFTAIDPAGIDALFYDNETGNTTYTVPVNVTLTTGIYTYTFYANDSLGNLGSETVLFNVSLGPLNISIIDIGEEWIKIQCD